MVVKREKILSKLLNGNVQDMTKVELKYIKDSLSNIYTVIDNTPIPRSSICRRYGIELDLLNWLDTNRVEYIKQLDNKLTDGSRSEGIIQSSEIVKELYKNKEVVVSMMRGGVKTARISEELDIMPHPRAYSVFREMMEDEGYSFDKKNRWKYKEKEM